MKRKTVTSKKPKPRKTPKPLKATYRELIAGCLTHDTMIEEDKLLTMIVCKKYGVTRARKTRKQSVRLKLKDGEVEGKFRCFKIGSDNFWRLGDGTSSAMKAKQSVTDEIAHYEAKARESAAKVEEFLLQLCLERLEAANKVAIPARVERELVERYKRDNAQVQEKRKLDLLKYASISDFGWIITENWGFFEPPFSNRGAFIAKIKELNEYRKRLAHPNLKPMDEEEMEYFSLAVRIFIREAKQ
jgi:hypothetical protein